MANSDILYCDSNCDCHSCSKCIHYGDCIDSDDFDFDFDDLNWTYIYASEEDKEA